MKISLFYLFIYSFFVPFSDADVCCLLSPLIEADLRFDLLEKKRLVGVFVVVVVKIQSNSLALLSIKAK